MPFSDTEDGAFHSRLDDVADIRGVEVLLVDADIVDVADEDFLETALRIGIVQFLEEVGNDGDIDVQKKPFGEGEALVEVDGADEGFEDILIDMLVEAGIAFLADGITDEACKTEPVFGEVRQCLAFDQEGPDLGKLTGLRGGNLLFHLEKLISAGMILQKGERKEYVLTARGHDLLGAVAILMEKFG